MTGAHGHYAAFETYASSKRYAERRAAQRADLRGRGGEASPEAAD